MKARYIFFLAFFLFAKISFCQVNFEIQKLETTCKIWGFLKYYHPTVADGKFDWDKELIDIYPKIKKASTQEEFSSILFDWIDKLGDVKDCRNCDENLKDVFNENFDLTWIMDENNLSPSLSSVLKNIEQNRFQGTPFYVSKAPAGNALMINESNKNIDDFPNEAQRLLGLFRYWNFIEYFYPYKYLTDTTWTNVLEEMIPKFLYASDTFQYHLAIKELVANIDDSHAWIGLTDKSKYKSFPYKVKSIDNYCVVSGFFNDEIGESESLELGDIILKINGKDVQKELENQSQYIPASNINRKNVFVYENMLSLEGNSLEVTIKRGDELMEKVVNLYSFTDFKYYDGELNVKWEIIKNNIGYVNIRLIEKNDVLNMMKQLSKCSAIIFDMRGYPKTSFFSISEYLNSEERPFAKVVNPEIAYPGKFVWSKTATTGRSNKDFFKGQVIILVDEQSISLSEFAIMAFQTADNAITIGSQTSGADGNVSVFEYFGGFRTAISGKGIYYPDGTPTQRLGVKIDYIVKPTIDGLREGRDEILEMAIDFIEKN
jgi:C-terminal processing protease CtpA/Prc